MIRFWFVIVYFGLHFDSYCYWFLWWDLVLVLGVCSLILVCFDLGLVFDLFCLAFWGFA